MRGCFCCGSSGISPMLNGMETPEDNLTTSVEHWLIGLACPAVCEMIWIKTVTNLWLEMRLSCIFWFSGSTKKVFNLKFIHHTGCQEIRSGWSVTDSDVQQGCIILWKTSNMQLLFTPSMNRTVWQTELYGKKNFALLVQQWSVAMAQIQRAAYCRHWSQHQMKYLEVSGNMFWGCFSLI